MSLFERKKINGTLDTIHFVGIGGIGMSGIAEVMHNLGYKVQGSDLVENYNTQRLSQYGISIYRGHAIENIKNIAYLVVSSDVKNDNIEVVTALEQKIPIIKRSEMLAELMRLKSSIAISGSHGKTTTTSLVACLFEAAGLNPTVINGGIINNKLTNAYIGSGDYLIAEADESDATFINIPSTIAVITNIDHEHMDFYKNFNSLVNAFKSFVTNLPFYGFAVACIDHPTVRQLVTDITERKILTYGIDSPDAHVQAFDINFNINSSTFNVKISLPNSAGSTTIEQVIIPTPGRHNVLNALAAITIAVELDFGIKTIKNGFRNFTGVKRRFTNTGEFNGASIIDDYAHHPVEVLATISTARSIANSQNGRVIAIFQPHRYSRMNYLIDEFASCFTEADIIYITEIYSAGESEIAGITSTNLVKKIKDNLPNREIKLLASLEQIAIAIKETAKEGDIIIMMGAGSISTWANQLPLLLSKLQ
ncbi:MAG: UDP-N-acetylmuramate--L-alanine ligase [Rickettsiaceae bacterium]|nr:MAG: UDP-N-acetylmuramate--L-alanine ligase [Rickettsiaceae bacterium]